MEDYGVLRILNVLFFIICVTTNGLGNAKIFSDYDVGQVSDDNPTMITPAGYAFIIWGIIYTLLCITAIYTALPSSICEKINMPRNNSLLFDSISYWQVAQYTFNALWIIIFVQNEVWSMIVCLVLIVSLLTSNLFVLTKLEPERKNLNWIEFIGFWVGYSIYTGWVSVATILNVSLVLARLGWKDGDSRMVWTEEGWTILILWVAVGIYVTYVTRWRNPVFGFVLAWASSAIMKKSGDDYDNSVSANAMGVMITMLVYCTVLAIMQLYEYFQKKDEKDVDLEQP